MGEQFDALTKQEQAVVARYVADEYDRLVFQSMRTASGLEAQADPAGWHERFREAIASDPLRLQSIVARAQKGFTLIELSIVLVVIGLIIGGVLVGRSLITQATTRNQIRQLQDLRTQVGTFYGKYGCLPGDCVNATTFFGTTDAQGHTVSNGDGDGLIRSILGTSTPYPAGECIAGGIQGTELPQAFSQLDDSGVGNYVSDGTGNDMNVGWPALQAIGNGTGLLLTCIGDPKWGSSPLDSALNGFNDIVLGANPNSGNPSNRIQYVIGEVSWAASPLPIGIPVDYVNMIDAKIDDGLPASGSFGVVGASGSGGTNPGPACLTNSNTTYPALGSSTCTATAGMRLGF